METAILAITKNGVNIGARLASEFSNTKVFSPAKLKRDDMNIVWYTESTSAMLGRLFAEYDALVCIFSLGAVVRLIAPHISNKKLDPAVLVIDDKLTHVISVLSGHIGGANQLARDIAARTGAEAIITTAADVNKTIAVDMVGRDMGWVIDDDSNVTATSAHMVNGEQIGVYQDAGSSKWWKGKLPDNVTVYDNVDTMVNSDCRAFLVITDKEKVSPQIRQQGVIYRPPSLVVGVGLHHTTTAEKITTKLYECLAMHNLSHKSVTRLASLKKPTVIRGLKEASQQMNIPVVYIDRKMLAQTDAPNPSKVVERFEGTPSVSEAAAMIVSKGDIIVAKQKYPPDLTLAVARTP